MSLIDACADDDDRARVESASAPSLNSATARREAGRTSGGCAGWTDQQLVGAASGERDAAFAELFHRHSASVTAVARMVLGADAGCDDVVAEVFTALWAAPEKFDPSRGSLRGFLRLGARGRSIDYLRSETSRHRREQAEGRGQRFRSAVDAEIIAAETGDELRRAMSQLSEGERSAIELAFFSEMTYREVARHVGLPEGTVKARIRSGLQRLSTEIDIEELHSTNEPTAPTYDAAPRSNRRGARR